MANAHFKTLPSQFEKELGVLSYIAAAGYMLGLNVTVRGPEYFFSTYPEGWQREYEKRNYMFIDPMMYWSMTRTGSCRWTEIGLVGRSSPVFKRAKAHGLDYGATLAAVEGGRRLLLSVSRPDREFEDSELEQCLTILRNLGTTTFDSKLTIEELDTLRLAAEGYSQKEIATELGIAEPTVKVRLSKVKDKLDARNTTHAVSIAIAAKLL